MTRVGTMLAVAAVLGFGASASAQTLKTVKQRGSLICGVSQGLAGLLQPG